VNQLYDQITDFAVEKKSVKRAKDADAKAEVGSSAFLTFLRGGLSFGARYSQTSEETGAETIIQKLMKTIDHIESNEKVLTWQNYVRRLRAWRLMGFVTRIRESFLPSAKLVVKTVTTGS
jgi:hypothetical protein